MSNAKNSFSEEKRLILVIEAGSDFCDKNQTKLSESYRVETCRAGDEAIDYLHRNADAVSLILMDDTNGLETLKAAKNDDALRRIPVIVLSKDNESELSSLQAGASDYILLPCDSPDVVTARVNRVIEASDGSVGGHRTDELTGIPNRDTFFRLAEEYDEQHPDRQMDAICIDISGFHIINDLYGYEHGSSILIAMAQEITQIAEKEDGIAGRKSADIFLLYLPHHDRYKGVLRTLQHTLTAKLDTTPNTIRLKMGVYPNVDKDIDIYSRFDRAKHARDTMHYSFSQVIAYYDVDKYREDLTSQQLLRDIDTALKEHQFKVYYQPKFKISGAQPELISAEALVRWHHPTMGVLFPGAFVPLFEENGMISRLDRYVWEETAVQIRRWRDKFGFTLPVSVNVSRIDLVGTDLTTIFLLIVQKNGLEPKDILIEITESAYTENLEELIAQVDKLRATGFRIEMDDFGSGYSSLNMLTSISIDTIKLDIDFIRNMFESEKNLQMLRLMMQIKDSLQVPIVAEGVETEEQLNLLRKIGCDIAQGYYFSKPILPEEFERFIFEKLRNNRSKG